VCDKVEEVWGLWKGEGDEELASHKEGGGFDPDLVYGEVSPAAFLDLLSECLAWYVPQKEAADQKPSFVDVGAGRGKAVACAALSGMVRESGGVEIEARHVLEGGRCLRRLVGTDGVEDDGAKVVVSVGTLGDARGEEGRETVSAWIVQGDARDGASWATSCGIAFVHGSTWSLPLQEAIVRAAERMPFGSLLVVTSNRVRSPLFEEVAERHVQMGWGEATVRVYRRIRLGRWAGRVLGRK
jgi:hypothetical protein